VSEADLLVHVIDSAQPNYEQQINAVYEVLEELKSIAKPIISVFNKADQLEKKLSKKSLAKYKPAVVLSALRGEGLKELLTKIDAQLPTDRANSPASAKLAPLS